MLKLVIIATEHNVLVEFYGHTGIVTAVRNYQPYNSGFCFGYGGGGPGTLIHAIMDIFYLKTPEESRHYVPARMEGYNMIHQRVTKEWEKPETHPFCGHTILEIPEEMVSKIPFFQLKDEYNTNDGKKIHRHEAKSWNEFVY